MPFVLVQKEAVLVHSQKVSITSCSQEEAVQRFPLCFCCTQWYLENFLRRVGQAPLLGNSTNLILIEVSCHVQIRLRTGETGEHH